MLNFPIVDTHVHFLLNQGLPYQSLKGDYTLSEYDEYVENLNVDTIIFMECDCNLSHYAEETYFATGVAYLDSRIKGIVSAFPIEEGYKRENDLDKLLMNKLVKAIRRLVRFESKEFMLDSDFIDGLKMLEKRSIPFDLCISLEQLEVVPKLVEQVPSLPIMLDHIGTPHIRDEDKFEFWKTWIKEIAKFPNVYCKLSSLATEANPKKWTDAEVIPYIKTLLEEFGVDRLAFGSDWPVSLVAATVEESVALLLKALEEYSESDKRKIFRDNALKFYNIET